MNQFQFKTITKASAVITAFNDGTIAHHCLTAEQVNFITRMAKKPMDYELSDSQNHRLNRIVGKV